MTARLFITPHYAVGGSDTTVDLTPFEGRLMTAMVFSGELPKDEAAEILWPDPDTMPDHWHSAIFCLMSRLRNKLRPFGWNVESRYGYGWKLERHDAGHEAAQEAQRAAA